MAGEVLADQTRSLVDHWRREIVGSIPNLIRHSRTPGGAPIPDYQTKSGLRFEQWVLDTCFRPYDQDNSSCFGGSPGAFRRWPRAASPNVRAAARWKSPTMQTCASGRPRPSSGQTSPWTPS
jgi:hypothetical protein